MTITRLLKRPQFLAVAASGLKWVRPAFVVQFLRHPTPPITTSYEDSSPHPTLSTTRIGFTVTKKQGNAVHRNRIRRRLREAARLTLPALAHAHCDYVIIGRRAAMDMPFDELKLELASAVTKVQTVAKKRTT